MKNQNKRIAVVSGGSKGIGLGIAKALILKGNDVYICARDKEQLKQAYDSLKEEILDQEDPRNSFGCLHYQVCDATKPEQVEALANLIQEKHSKLDILINNCGGLLDGGEHKGTFNELSEDSWLASYSLNVVSVVSFCKYFYPLLVASEHPRVINISSVVASMPGHFNPHYAAAKSALLVLSKNLSALWAKDSILVNTISPGIIETEGWQAYINEKARQENRPVDAVMKQENERATNGIPLGRLGNVDEIGSCVAFLSSIENSYMTGSHILIDGGKCKAI
ncbi:SDR family NAD(P)-dependent oxidoreductase [Catenovulum sediminis]|uniref:SDR family oxidoreductase n=1 Tax=Catenovulum sediminis TaxID=1740262 RepID=A0ABV1RGZ1_9ALTE